MTCDLLTFQGLVFEEERPPPPNRAPLAPMLEFVSAQTGLPVVAVGGGSSLGREPQVRTSDWACGSTSDVAPQPLISGTLVS